MKATNTSLVVVNYAAFGSVALAPFFITEVWMVVGCLIIWQWFNIVGLSAGAHRYFSHGSFETSSFWKWVMGLSSMWCLNGPPCIWADAHKKHHHHADKEEDPYMRFFLDGDTPVSHTTEVKDSFLLRMCRDRFHLTTLKHHWELVLIYPLVLAFINPMLVFWLWLVPAGLAQLTLRILLWVTHVRSRGYRNFNTKDNSVNVWWLSLIAGGEGWHNNHHRNPSRSNFKIKPWEIDISYWFINLIRNR